MTAMIFATLPGCIGLQPSGLAVTQACQDKCEAAPRCCRGNVHVFLVHGFDPFDFGGTGDLRHTLNRLGFKQVYSGQFYHASGFADEIKDLAAANANARFVIVGIGAGVDAALSLADTVGEHGVTIDLLASVDSPFWSSAPAEKPSNVQRVLALHDWPSAWVSWTPSAEMDIAVPDSGWLGVRSHPLTLETLALELASVAGAVPATIEEVSAPTDDAPVPRAIAANTANQRHVVSYLDPAATLEGRDTDSEAVPASPLRRELGP